MTKKVTRPFKRKYRLDFWDLVDLVDDARRVLEQRQVSIPERFQSERGPRESVAAIFSRSKTECGDIARCI